MNRREAAERLVELNKKFPPARRPMGFQFPLTVEGIEGTLRWSNYAMGEESLKTHPLYPAELLSRWHREKTAGERKLIAEREAKALELAARASELEPRPAESTADRLRREIAERTAILDKLEPAPSSEPETR